MSAKGRLFALALTLVLLAVGREAPAAAVKPASEPPVYIGASNSLTGNGAVYGEEARRGLEVAKKQINDAGGVLGRPIEIIYRDGKSDPKEGAALAQEFCQNKDVSFIIGDAESSVTLAEMPIYQECRKLVLNADSGSTELTARYHYFWHVIAPSSVSFTYAASFFIDQFKPKKVAIVYQQTDWTAQGKVYFENVVKQKGLELVANEPYIIGQADYKSLITSLKVKNPDMVLLGSYYQDAGMFVQQSRELGFNPTFVGVASIASQGLINVGGKAVEGVCMVSGFSSTSPRPEVRRFVERVKAQFGSDPFNQQIALNYDALILLANSINRAKSLDVDKVWKAISEMGLYHAVTGDITWGPDREPQKTLFPLIVKDGKFVDYVPQK